MHHKNRTDKVFDDIALLPMVEIIWDLWSVRIIRPRLSLRVRHGPEDHTKGRGFSWRMGRRRELTRGELYSSCKSQLKGDVIGGRKEANGAGFCLEWWTNQMGRVMTRDGQSRMVSIRAWSSCISTRQEASSLKILAPKGWNVDVVVGFPCKTVNLEQLASRGPTQS